MKRLQQISDDFEHALTRLEEAAQNAHSNLEIDGSIQRFEFSFELFWKLLKAYLEKEGIACRSPKGCLKEAFQFGVIDDQTIWLMMLDDRNRSVHIYDEQVSREIFGRIKSSYLEEFKKTFRKIQEGVT